MESVEKYWVVCRWRVEELNRKRVEFSLSRSGLNIKGRGEILALRRPDQKLQIKVCFTTMGRVPNEFVENQWMLDQAEADTLLEHPDKKVADFAVGGV